MERTLRGAGALFFATLLLFGEAASVGAITREAVLQRALHWITIGVPYSQSQYFEGYRTDCSGFVSMSWELTDTVGAPLSLASDTLPGRAVAIEKDRLLPGDMIVRPKTAGTWGHSVVFAGWADASRDTYWCYEQSNSAGGARLRQTPYPYWPTSGSGFLPYRYQAISEDTSGTARVAGTDRYSTSVSASIRAFPDPESVDVVVLATGDSWPDALGGSGLAGAVRGPLLLTGGSLLPDSVRDEILRLEPARVLVIGGDAAVSESVIRQVREAGVGAVERIAGGDRYETAALVAVRAVREVEAAGGTFDGTAYVTTGEQFPDALAISPVAAFRRRPVLLVRSDALPQVTWAALAELGVEHAHIVGGETAVGAVVNAAVAESSVTVERIAGIDRYATALAVVEHATAEGLSLSQPGVATGAAFPDALAAGPALGLSATPNVLLLSPPSGLSPELYTLLSINSAEIDTVYFYGGPAALSDQVRAEASAALRGW